MTKTALFFLKMRFLRRNLPRTAGRQGWVIRGLILGLLLILPFLAAGCRADQTPMTLDGRIKGPALILFYTDN